MNKSYECDMQLCLTERFLNTS